MAQFSRPRLWAVAVSGLALAIAAGTLACRRPGATESATAPSVEPTYDKAGRLTRIAYDRNHDGKTDAWLNMHGARVVSAELDDNFDGVIDRKEFYGDGQPPAAGQSTATISTLRAGTALLRAEQSTRGDGKMNRFETYEGGRMVRVEEDTNGDGRIDKWETWSGGVLQIVALDTRGTGHPDRRLVYPADGSSPRMEVDATGSGTFTPIATER